MRRKTNGRGKAALLLIFLLFALQCTELFAVDVNEGTFTIGNGDEYSVVDVWNDAIVTMIGGTINTRLTLNDESTFIANGGSIGSGADISLSGMSQLHLHLLEFPVSHRVQTGENSDAEIHVYGYNFEYVPSSADWILNGYWADQSAFSIRLRGPFTKPNVILHEVPEPASILFFSLISIPLLKRSH